MNFNRKTSQNMKRANKIRKKVVKPACATYRGIMPTYGHGYMCICIWICICM